MNETVLATRALTKRYGKRNAVDSVSISVRRGDIYGFLGPNGAGKTTTLRMVTGLISPTSGAIELLGRNPAKAPRSLMAQVGALIEGPAYYPHLTATENLRLIQGLKGSGGGAHEAANLLDLVGLARAARQKVEQFSLGMKQRLGIAMALVGQPRLLVLDEPTNGLDPEGFREFRALLRLLAEQEGITVLLSSHLLHEVEQVATRVGVISDGRLLTEATVEELRRTGERSLEVTVDRPAQAAELIRERMHLTVEPMNGHGLLVRGRVQAADLNALLVRNDLAVSRLMEREASLEQIFFELTGGTASGQNAAS